MLSSAREAFPETLPALPPRPPTGNSFTLAGLPLYPSCARSVQIDHTATEEGLRCFHVLAEQWTFDDDDLRTSCRQLFQPPLRCRNWLFANFFFKKICDFNAQRIRDHREHLRLDFTISALILRKCRRVYA